MLLYLLRHADAVSNAESDAARELTEKGIAQARRVGKFIRRNDLGPAVILTSPFRRAMQTAELAAAEFDSPEITVAQFLQSGMQPEAALEELKAYAGSKSVMIVGHEPDF